MKSSHVLHANIHVTRQQYMKNKRKYATNGKNK